MAQVKKLQDGGNPSKKYFMFNGTKIVEGDDNFKQLEQYALSGNRFAQRILETLPKSNNDIVVNTSSDGVDFKNLDMDYYNERTGKQFEKGDNLWRRTFRTKEGKNYIEDAIKIKFTPLSKNKAEDEEDDLIDISTGIRRFSYDKDGKYDQYLQSNANFLKTLDQIIDYFTLGREAGDKKYKFSGEGLDMDAMWSIYNNPNSPIDLADFRKRILAGDVDDSDPAYRFLDPFFQGRGSVVTEDGQQIIADQKQADAWKEWSDRGFGNTADTKNFVYDSNSGKWVLNPNILASLGLDANSGAWFNDNFIRNHYGYDFLKDKVLLNGNWYTTADLTNPNSEAYKYLNSAQNDYYNKNRRGETDAADAVMMTSWGDKYKSVYNPEYIGNLYNNANIEILDYDLSIPSTLYNGKQLDDTYSIIRYRDKRDKDELGLGQRPIKHTIMDRYGNFVGIDKDGQIVSWTDDSEYDGPNRINVEHGIPVYDISSFSNLYDNTTDRNNQQLPSALRRLADNPESPYYNWYQIPGIQFNENEKLQLFRDSNGNAYAIFPQSMQKDQNRYFQIPSNLVEMFQNSQFWNAINNDVNAARALKDVLTKLSENKSVNSDDMSALTYLINQFYNNYVYNPEHWRSFEGVPVQWKKNGGIIKAESGTSNLNNRAIPDKVVDLSLKNPYQSSALFKNGKINWNEFSAADKAELFGLIGDIGTAIAGYAGVADIATIPAGIVSNALQYYADRQRVKEGVYSPGAAAGNFLKSTAIDLASIVPIAGDSLNLSNSLTKASKWLRRNQKLAAFVNLALLSVNTPQALHVIEKLKSDEPLTIDDARIIYQAAVGTINAGKSFNNWRQDKNLANELLDKPQPRGKGAWNAVKETNDEFKRTRSVWLHPNQIIDDNFDRLRGLDDKVLKDNRRSINRAVKLKDKDNVPSWIEVPQGKWYPSWTDVKINKNTTSAPGSNVQASPYVPNARDVAAANSRWGDPVDFEKQGGILKAKPGARLSSGKGRLGVFPEIELIDAIELGKYFNAKKIAKDNERLYKNIAEITARNQLPLLQDNNRRIILPQYNAARAQIADARLQSRLYNSMFADARVAIAGWLGSEKNIMDTTVGYNKTISDSIANQHQAHSDRKFKRDLANQDMIAHNITSTNSGAIAGENAELYRNTVESDLENKFGMYWQNKLNNQSKADFVAEEQARYYDKLAAATTNNPALKQAYINFAAELRSEDYKNRLAKSYHYGLKAKQGGKLRSTSDQMLIDNQKLVAKAIEKLNDNTAKLILKALS